MDDYSPVLSKTDFARRYKAGEFGNHAPTWDTVDELRSSRYVGLIHVRNRVAGGKTWYNIWSFNVPFFVGELEQQGYKPESLYLSAMAPERQKVFQGEVSRGLWGLDLTYNTLAMPMRQGMRKGLRTACGTMALTLLDHYLCPNSRDWLDVLLQRYPDHVVEFSTYSRQWGTLPGYNTLFWEVRKY